MRNFFMIMLGLLIVASCKNEIKDKIEYKTPEFYFADAVEIKGEPLDAEYVASNVFKCFYTPYGFLGSMRSEDDKLAHLADLKTGEIKVSACSFGRGPEEILISSPDLALYGNSLYMLDQRADWIKKVEIHGDTLKTFDLQKLSLGEPMFFIEIQIVSDSLFVIFAENFNGEKKIVQVDRDNNIVDSVVYSFLDDENVDCGKCRYNVEMELSPCKKYLYVSSHLFSGISKYQIEDGKISLVDKVMLVEPKYVVKNGTPVMELENVILNNRIFVGEKYLYMTADPEKVSDMKEREKRAREEGRRESAAPGNDSYIVVFDYDLNFIKSYRVDSDVWHLALTPDPSVVYASDYRENRLKRYVLADLK